MRWNQIRTCRRSCTLLPNFVCPVTMHDGGETTGVFVEVDGVDDEADKLFGRTTLSLFTVPVFLLFLLLFVHFADEVVV